MALLQVLQALKAEYGIKYENADERNVALSRINDAALEIYSMEDFKGSQDEKVFDLNQGTQQVALPEYVGAVRGMRYYDTLRKIPINHMGNRFAEDNDDQCWDLNYREKTQSVLKRELDNQSILKFSSPVADTQAIVIAIQGPTRNAARYTEEITIPPNSTDPVSTIGNYITPLHSIRKNRVTTYDISVEDVEGNVVAVIPNIQYNSVYWIYQIHDYVIPVVENSSHLAVEVWYKKRFIPFSANNDQFLFTDEWDRAIVWKFLEHRAKTPQAALALQMKCNQILNIIQADKESGKKRKITFGECPFFDLPYEC